MTTEDAIYVIGQIGQWMSPKEAFTMAIDALEKQKEQGPVHEDDSKPQTDAEILTHYLWWAESDEENCPYTWKRLAKAIKAGIDALNQTLPEADTKTFNDGVKEGRRLEREDTQPSSGDSKKPNNHAEWSEEDKKMLEASISFVQDSPFPYYGDTFRGHIGKDEAENWLKSLPKRLKSLYPQPQRKDTYYDIIHSILAMLKDMDFMQITPEHRVSLLNDIRVKCKNADECAAILDEPHWKPSKKQMEALMLAIEGKCPPTSYMSRRLEDLYEELRKLT